MEYRRKDWHKAKSAKCRGDTGNKKKEHITKQSGVKNWEGNTQQRDRVSWRGEYSSKSGRFGMIPRLDGGEGKREAENKEQYNGNRTKMINSGKQKCANKRGDMDRRRRWLSRGETGERRRTHGRGEKEIALGTEKRGGYSIRRTSHGDSLGT